MPRERMYRSILAVLVLAAALTHAHAAELARQLPSLDDLYADPTLPDVAISPSGRYVAAILHHQSAYHIQLVDLTTNESRTLLRADKDFAGGRTDAEITAVYWKTDDRLLFRTWVGLDTDASYVGLSDRTYAKLGSRMFAIDRDGKNLLRLLSGTSSSALDWAFDLGAVVSWLPNDPNHVMMVVDGAYGRALLRVDLTTGHGEVIEKPIETVTGWWLDVDGMPQVRVQWTGGAMIMSRKEADGKWKTFLKIRRKEFKKLPDFDEVGPSDQPNKHYVLARPAGRDRVGLYLYDLGKESFGDPVVENPKYDLMSARISRDGKRVLQHCYVADIRICEFADPKLNAHIRGVRKYFSDAVNAYVYDNSQDGNVYLFYVEGPNLAPSFHHYRTDRKRIEPLGFVKESLQSSTLPTASVVSWKARDGLELSGYLTVPAGITEPKSLPLVMMPHGGPEARDQLTFDYEVQYLAARGYAVFQPNFRGSEGFGEAFAKRGYREWGLAMQNDVTDSLQALIERGIVDPKRVCIVGASYGGYVALAGAALTPDLYRCAVSRAGITDLDEFLKSRKRKFGADSEVYSYWLDSIGDPKVDADKLAAASPARLANRIKIPVLLLHGTQDGIVPFEQSASMKKALDQAGHATELLAFKNEGHSSWSTEHQKAWLIAVDRFLWQHIGPGVGISAPPPPLPDLNRKKN